MRNELHRWSPKGSALILYQILSSPDETKTGHIAQQLLSAPLETTGSNTSEAFFGGVQLTKKILVMTRHRKPQIIKELWRPVSHGDCRTTHKADKFVSLVLSLPQIMKTIKKVPLWTLENENSIILWLKERQPSPQNLGRAACKFWGRGKPHNLAYFINKWPYKNNLQ